MTHNQFFIGFGVFEDLLDAEKKGRPQGLCPPTPRPPIFIENLIKTLPGPIANIRVRQFYIVATIVIGNECWYWRMTAKTVDDWGVGDSQQQLEDAQKKSDLICAIVSDHATKQGFNVIRASVSFPQDLALTEGTSNLFGYDKETSLIVAKVKEAA